MFGWFKRSKDEVLTFKDNREAFEYACKHLDNELLLEKIIPAYVEETGSTGEEGERYFRLLLAEKDGGREHWGCTLKEATAFPSPGDFIGFRVVKIAPDLPDEMNLIGYIAMRLEPVYITNKGWRIAENLTPKNIRPTFRW